MQDNAVPACIPKAEANVYPTFSQDQWYANCPGIVNWLKAISYTNLLTHKMSGTVTVNGKMSAQKKQYQAMYSGIKKAYGLIVFAEV